MQFPAVGEEKAIGEKGRNKEPIIWIISKRSSIRVTHWLIQPNSWWIQSIDQKFGSRRRDVKASKYGLKRIREK